MGSVIMAKVKDMSLKMTELGGWYQMGWSGSSRAREETHGGTAGDVLETSGAPWPS